MVFIFLFAMVVYPYVLGYRSIVDFPGERIEIYVFPERISVVGYYQYSNPWPFPVVQSYYYPLPLEHEKASSADVSVVQLGPEKQSLPCRYYWRRHRFEAHFKSKSRATIRVAYEQQAPGHTARYILVTTKDWGRALEEGVYRIYPHNVRITKSNYKLEVKSPGELGFEKRNFMPDFDWQFSWEVIEP